MKKIISIMLHIIIICTKKTFSLTNTYKTYLGACNTDNVIFQDMTPAGLFAEQV